MYAVANKVPETNFLLSNHKNRKNKKSLSKKVWDFSLPTQ